MLSPNLSLLPQYPLLFRSACHPFPPTAPSPPWVPLPQRPPLSETPAGGTPPRNKCSAFIERSQEKAAVKWVQIKMVALEGAGPCPHSGPALGAPVGSRPQQGCRPHDWVPLTLQQLCLMFAETDQEEQLRQRTQHRNNSPGQLPLWGSRIWGLSVSPT